MVGAAAAARVALSLLRGGSAPARLPGEWAQLRQGALERLIARARLTAPQPCWRPVTGWRRGRRRRCAEQDPYEESALRTLMRAHVDGGQAATALAAYARRGSG